MKADNITDAKTVAPGSTFFVALFLVFTLFLLSQLGAETKFSPTGKLFAQPRFWPAVGVIGMAVFAVGALITSLLAKNKGAASAVLSEVALWVRALEYLVWFMAYVTLVPIIGYLIATLLFTVLLACRQGYRAPRQLINAAVMGVFIVVIFKAGLAVKIPGGAWYEYLPDALRNFMIVNF